MACAGSSPQAQAPPPPYLSRPPSSSPLVRLTTMLCPLSGVWGDFFCGRPRPSPVSASSMSSQHASHMCSATADGKTPHDAVHPAVSSSAQSAVSHSSAEQCLKSAGQDSIQDATPQYCIADFGMRQPVPSRVQTPSMTSIQHASGTGAKLPPQASASSTIPPSTHASIKLCTRPTAHDKRSLANNVAPNMSSQNGSQISTKPSQRQTAEEKASRSEQSAPVNSQATSDIRTDPTCQFAPTRSALLMISLL